MLQHRIVKMICCKFLFLSKCFSRV